MVEGKALIPILCFISLKRNLPPVAFIYTAIYIH